MIFDWKNLSECITMIAMKMNRKEVDNAFIDTKLRFCSYKQTFKLLNSKYCLKMRRKSNVSQVWKQAEENLNKSKNKLFNEKKKWNDIFAVRRKSFIINQPLLFPLLIPDQNNSLSQTIPDKTIELCHFPKLCEQRRKFRVLYKLEFQVIYTQFSRLNVRMIFLLFVFYLHIL